MADRRKSLTAKPFSIGLSPLGTLPWLIADNRLPDFLAEKARLRDIHPEKIFAAEPETAAAQAETLERVVAWQLTHYPERFSRKADAIQISGVADPVCLGGNTPPLQTAAELCAEDLVLMRKGEDGWRLAAASLSFPSSWSLAEKFSLTIDDVHKPVPGFAGGTRNASLVNRIFDNLAPDEPVLRGNWSIYGDRELYHPVAHSGANSGEEVASGVTLDPDKIFLREERQTLTCLPKSGDLLFTILISLTSLQHLAETRSGRARAAEILLQFEAMTPEELTYKALARQKPALSSLLREIVGARH